MLSVIVAGLVVGASYALTGAAFAVAYRSSRILNFALGGTGGLAAFIAVTVLDRNMPWGVAFLAAVATGAVLGAAQEVLVGRKLTRISPLTAAIGMLGVLLILQGLTEYIWGTTGHALIAPFGLTSFHPLQSLSIQASDVLYVGLAVTFCLSLLWFLYYTAYGLQMRAASAGPVTAEHLGIRVSMTGTVGWSVGGALGAAAAVFVASSSTLVASTYTEFIFLALIALVVGGLSSIWGVMLGGFAFGVGLSVIQVELSTRLTYTFALIFLGALLFFRPEGLLGRPEAQLNEPTAKIDPKSITDVLAARSERVAQLLKGLRRTIDADTVAGLRAVRSFSGAATVLGIMLALWWIGPPLIALSLPQVVSNFIAVLGLDIILGYCGQLNLAQGAFVAVGAYSGAITVAHLGLSAWLILPVGAIGAAAIGVLVGLPAVRLSHLYYAQITLLFAFVVPELLLFFDSITGGSTGLTIGTLGLSSLQQYLLYLGIAIAVVAAVKPVLGSRMGRHWRAIRDNEPVDRTLGQRTSTTKLWAFGIGSGLAGLAGAMQALTVGTISPESYPVWVSIYLQAAQVVGGMTSLLGNLLGAFFVTVVPIYAGSGGRLPTDLIFGVVFVLVMLLAPRGLAYTVEYVWRLLWMAGLTLLRRASATVQGQRSDVAGQTDSIDAVGPVPAKPVAEGERLRGAPEPRLAVEDRGAVAAEASSDEGREAPILSVRQLTAGYRGGEVLHSVTVEVPRGHMVAVVGPNGAGKSTLLRAVMGVVRPSSGEVLYEGASIRGLRTFEIARRGLGQVVEGRGIFPDLSVAENLRLGRIHRAAGRGSSTASETTDWVHELFPILGTRRRQVAGTLSGGEQQMLAIARSLLMEPKCLLLDEPLLGLAPVVSETVIDRLQEIQNAGVSILIVEQNVYQVLAVSSWAYFLGSGRVVASGAPDELSRRSDLFESYLGLTRTPQLATD